MIDHYIRAAAPTDLPAAMAPARCTITGDLDYNNAEDLRRTLTTALPIGEPVVVDMRAVTFFSTSSLQVLLEVKDLAAVRHCHLHILTSRCVDRVLDTCGVETEIDLPPQHSQRYRD